jgi:S-adenosylmethionine:tRNA ribosyltransferase-isomerase
MRRADFSYPLPQELIAQQPLPTRTASRLLALDGADGKLRDLMFTDLPMLLRPADLLVLNDTRVLPARVLGRKDSGGACEILLERLLGPRRFLAQARASKALRPGGTVSLPAGATATVASRHGDLYEFELDREAVDYFETEGSMPLPPYIARAAGDLDPHLPAQAGLREAGRDPDGQGQGRRRPLGRPREARHRPVRDRRRSRGEGEGRVQAGRAQDAGQSEDGAPSAHHVGAHR